MHEGGREQLDLGDIAANVQELDIFADTVWLGEDDREPRHEIAEHALQGDADSEPGHADAGDQRRDLEAELVEPHHGREQHDDDLEDADDQQSHGRLHRLLLQSSIHELADPSGHDRACGQDHQRAEYLESVTDREIQDDVSDGHRTLLGVALRAGRQHNTEMPELPNVTVYI